jgi:pilus assembly protein Flp/PilA
MMELKFSRQPTEETLDGSMPGRNLWQPTKRRTRKMLKKLMAKMQDEEGQGLVEYALIIVLVSIVCIIALTALGTNVSTVFSNIATTLNP